jgi:hypothetical protein
MKNEEITTVLTTKFQYSRDGAELIADKIHCAKHEIQDAFFRFLEFSVLPDITFEDVHIKQLIDEYDMDPIAALLTMDWITRDPKKAKASLKKGIDKPMFRYSKES